MKKLDVNCIIDRVFSPMALILYLFSILLFETGIFSIISIKNKLIVLSIIIVLNIIFPLIIERFIKNRKILSFFLNSFLLITSTVIVSTYIPTKIAPIVYLCVFWIIALKTLLNIDLTISSLGAFAFIFYMVTLSMNANLTIYFILILILSGLIISLKIYNNVIKTKNAVISFILGICCAIFASTFL